MTIKEAVLALKRYQGYEPMEDGNILKHSFDLTDETVDTLLSAIRTEPAGEPLTLEQLQHMDEQRELARRMREMAVNTGGLDCLGCGYEHSCGVHGCAVLRRASDLLAPAVDITTPIPLDRLRELVEADRDGRCVVLPCKIGDPVWRLYDDCDFPGDCYTTQKCGGCEYRNLFIEEQAFCLSMLSQNGKLDPPYYTTLAEAEAALRRKQDE